MVGHDGDDGLDMREERIRQYRADAFLSGIDSRVFSIEMHWAASLSARERGEAARAEGHLRLSVNMAVALAAEPAGTRPHALRKASFLTLTIARLDPLVAGDAHRDHRGAIRMLVAATEAEVGLWKLARPKPGGGEKRTGSPDFEPSPTMRRALSRNAEPRALAAACAYAEVMHADALRLADAEDWGSVRGVTDQVRASLLHSLAIPATSLEDLAAKIEAIDRFANYLRPSHLTAPMLVAVLAADGEALRQPVDFASVLRSLPRGTGD